MTLKKLGRYELIRVRGKGAMGVVYEGRDPNLDRRVAIKTVKVENLSEEAAAEYEHRFRTEARSAARLQHPNIVSVYDCDRDGDVAFLVMEYIEGDDLKYHLDRGTRYALEQSLRIIRDLLSALDYAHRQGIVHRDIKPANLLVEPGGRVKLTDFGVARMQDSGDATRTQGAMVGTLKYMAPEQVQAQKVDARADLFSVGVVLYQLLTDRRPFDGENDFSIIQQIVGHNPTPPSSIHPRLPSALDAVVARALAKDRDERFASARDFAVALQAAVRRAEDQTVLPPPDPARKLDPAATRSRPGATAPGMATVSRATPGSVATVTQELELVYWKDVKDTSDPEDLQGFLNRFPDGIYAALARRRLRKLLEASTQGTTTAVVPVVPQAPDPPATGMRPQPFEGEDRARPSGTPSARAGAAASGTAASGAAAGTDDAATVGDLRAPQTPEGGAAQGGVAPRPQTVAARHAVIASAQGQPAAPPSAAPVMAGSAAPATPVFAAAGAGSAAAVSATEAPTAAPAAKKRPALALAAAVAVVALTGLAYALLGGSSPPGAGTTAAGVPTHAALAASAVAAPADGVGLLPVEAPVASLPALPASEAAGAGPAAAAVAHSAASANRAPEAVRASAASVAPDGADKPPEGARRGREATPPRESKVRPQPRPQSGMVERNAPAPAVTAAAPTVPRPDTSAVEQCRGKLFLSRELCLKDRCARPGVRSHALCVQYREQVRLREQGKVRQGPQQEMAP